MKTPDFKNMFNVVKAFTTQHSPEILTGLGIAGMVTTTVLAVKATPKALQLIEDAKYEKEDTLTVPETIKATWKCYIPAAVTGVASISCLLGASSVSLKRNAALATAYKLSETALMEYKEQVIDTIGERKEKDIRDKVAKKKLEKDPVSSSTIVITDKGNTLCYDAVIGRYFKSDIETIKKAVNELNRQMLLENYISLNEFYNELGLENCDVGDSLGWNIETGYIEPEFSTQLADDGTPCVVLSYMVEPRYDYRNLH